MVSEKKDFCCFLIYFYSCLCLNGQVGSAVILVGRIMDDGTNGFSTLEASDGVTVRIQKAESTVYSTAYQEIVGHVHHDNQGGIFVQEFIARDFGDTFNVENYDKAIALLNGPFQHIYFGGQKQ